MQSEPNPNFRDALRGILLLQRTLLTRKHTVLTFDIAIPFYDQSLRRWKNAVLNYDFFNLGMYLTVSQPHVPVQLPVVAQQCIRHWSLGILPKCTISVPFTGTISSPIVLSIIQSQCQQIYVLQDTNQAEFFIWWVVITLLWKFSHSYFCFLNFLKSAFCLKTGSYFFSFFLYINCVKTF